jgi:adenosylcobinamide kinase / adenosylcobinamide-phosphate guanylyltransferase
MIRLLLGGTKSGKSALGEALLLAGPGPWRVIATGRALDFGFRERIAAHKRARPAEVAVIEAGAEALDRLAREAQAGGTVLFDSLDFWLFGRIGARQPEDAATALARGLVPFAGPGGPEVIVVSAEIGLGPLPADAATRRFAGELGTLNQAAAALAHDVRLVVAGVPLSLKEARP